MGGRTRRNRQTPNVCGVTVGTTVCRYRAEVRRPEVKGGLEARGSEPKDLFAPQDQRSSVTGSFSTGWLARSFYLVSAAFFQGAEIPRRYFTQLSSMRRL